MEQVEYYNQFGKIYKQQILNCPEPEVWTTDYKEKGRVFQEMKDRIEIQDRFINKYFDKVHPVLDIGCGFGRQAFRLAKEGFRVTGIDSSEVFIEIARELFAKHQYKGQFRKSGMLELDPQVKFCQVLLLDVLEHIPPSRRKTSILHLSAIMETGGLLIISLPHRRKRLRSMIYNNVIKRITGLFAYFRSIQEHPYMIPAKNQVMQLFLPYFTLIEYHQSAKTDYFIFRRNS